MSSRSPDEWIDEAIAQYELGEQYMAAWKDLTVGSAAETMAYKQAANHTQRAAAAAAIATAKMHWDMTDS